MPSESPVILFTEDNEFDRHFLTHFLQRKGFVVWEARTGGETLSLMVKKPDLVILDVNLPDMSGVEVCRQIKADPATSSVPVLHVSGTFCTSEDRVDALETGADGYLVKPLNPREVIAQVGALLRMRRAEQEIKKLNEDLARRTTELEAANKELEAFCYSVSHDLRAPVRGVMGLSRILLEEFRPQLPTDVQRYLQLLHDNGRQMGQLIDDLLSFSRLSRQPLKKQAVAVADIVRRCLDELEAEKNGRKVEILVETLSPCAADPALLKQVWSNLISNALKYTGKREMARIEIGSTKEPAHGCVYYIRDNGVGFDMRYVKKLFGVFQRLHAAEDYPGTGVGLAIVLCIIQRHGGRVWAEAEVNRGATFYFTVPNGDA